MLDKGWVSLCRVVIQDNTDATSQRSQVRITTSSKTASWKTNLSKPASTSTKTPAREYRKSPPPSPKAPMKEPQPPSQSPLRRSPRVLDRKMAKENSKCKLMDINGDSRVVAEGRWASNNPDQTVHFVPLGANAVRVWIDVVKVSDAAVWRPCSEIEYMEDAIGTSIAWPEDKVIMC